MQELTEFNLKALVVGIKTDIQIHNYNLNLKLNYDMDLPEILIGNPEKTTQILTNLIQNAIKARGTNSNVTIHLEISEETQKAITLDVIVENLNNHEEPSTTRLILKKKEEVFKNMSGDIVQHGHFPLKGVKLLLVDDLETNRKFAAKFLKKWKIEVDLAVNGKEAVEKVQQQAYDVILMDLHMPVMDGYEATQQIRLLDKLKYQNLPIIAFTSISSLEIKNNAPTLDMTDRILKPLNPNELFEKLVKYTKG